MRKGIGGSDVVLGQLEGILYDGLDGAVLNSEGPPPPGRVDKSCLWRPTEFVMLSLVNGEFTFFFIFTDVGLSIVWSGSGGPRLVPDGSLTDT